MRDFLACERMSFLVPGSVYTIVSVLLLGREPREPREPREVHHASMSFLVFLLDNFSSPFDHLRQIQTVVSHVPRIHPPQTPPNLAFCLLSLSAATLL
jgi:hypothetical protein